MENGDGSYRRFLDGDGDAFAEIMDNYRLGLIFFINRYLRDEAAAEDLAIDVFADVLVHPHRYNFKVSLKTYLYMLGRSRALNYLKRKRIIEIQPLSDAEILPSDEPSPDELLLADERRRAVSRALDRLSADMRAAVHLVYFEELSYRDAAKIMKKTEKQVDNLLYRAKAALRSLLEKEGELL